MTRLATGNHPRMFALAMAGAIAISIGAPTRAAAPAKPDPLAGATFRHCRDCPDMVAIPAGKFVMGSTQAETDREKMPAEQAGREHPQKTVTIPRPFALAQTEVTIAQYAVFAAETRRGAGECQAYFKVPGTFQGWLPVHGSAWDQPVFPQGSDHPVVCVTWEDARDYAAWLAAKSGKHYRLPSEAEWEYAARAGTQTARYWGDGVDEACRYANVADVRALRQQFTCDDGYAHTAPATYGIANGFGLYGMLGNVGEWTADCGLHSFDKPSPTDGSADTTGDCKEHVGRGGSWWNDAYYIRAARRFSSVGRYYILGFRVAMDLN